METLRLEHVAKSFGALEVIRDLSFGVGERSVFGLIGKNGAGKTTAMKIILGLLKASGGSVSVCGEKVVYGSSKTNRFVGYLPDVPEFYGFMRPREYLKLCGEISGLKPAEIKKRTGELLELVGLGGVNRKIGGFSRGMKQRLGIAQALLGKPALLVCDEPTSALDPVGRKEILDILSVAKARTSIVFSTHILSDVERVCDEIGILEGGRLVLSGRLSEVKKAFRCDKVLIEPAARDSAQALAERLSAEGPVRQAEAEGGGVVVRLDDARADSFALMSYLAAEKIPVIKFEVLEPSLEDVFLEAIQ